MAASSYNAALTRLLKDEGGYSDHPSDPGGPTNWGITLADARRYWKGNATAADMRAMPESMARKIYRERYWNAQRCDELPAGVDYAVFDYGVNSGIGRSGKVLRRVLKLSDATSAVTDDVIAAACNADAASVVKSICAERLAFLRSLKTFPVFGRGWTARVNGVQAAALMMAGPQRPQLPAPKQIESAPGKAFVPATTSAGTPSAGAVIAAGAASAASTGRIEIALIVVVAAAIAATAIFLIWRWCHRAQQEAVVKGSVNGLG